MFQETVAVYRAVADYLINVCIEQWDTLSQEQSSQRRLTIVEHMIHRTKQHPDTLYDFDDRFYKFPSYLRRAAINEATGKVSSYVASVKNWEAADPKTRGKRPGKPVAGYVYPCMYRDNMYREIQSEDPDTETEPYLVQLKVYIRNTWDWITVRLRKSDVDYIQRHCSDMEVSAPTLQKRGKRWRLDFAFTEEHELRDGTDISRVTVAAVDLGIHNAAVISIMRSDGTVVGREFLSLPSETDSLNHALSRLKKAQRNGAKKTPRLWAAVNGINDRIAVLTAKFIIDTAEKYQADVIVMESLDTKGKKRGSKKQRLHLWKSQYVQKMVTGKAHRKGMRISRVSAWNTSILAYDGSGPVKRGRASEKTNGSYSLCEFTTGKVYHADLNASYNIGARYFIREILKPCPETERLALEAKVPEVARRSTCTLSALINLNAVLAA